jgi:hypothetical protein
VVAAYLRVEAARVLGLSPERLDLTTPLSSLGFDSLMAVQLKNCVEADLQAGLLIAEYLQGPSVNQLSTAVLQAIDGSTLAAEPFSAAEGETWEEGSL